MESQGNRRKMNKPKRENQLLAFTGAAAVLALAVNLAVSAVRAHRRNRRRKDLRGSNVRVDLSAREILKLADRIAARSKEVHDVVASVPLDKVSYTNVVLPLAELEAEEFSLVQSCIFPKMVSVSDDVRQASAQAERRIDAHKLSCSLREDVYRVVKALLMRGDWMNPEASCYLQFL